jgi:hypothetical protein
MIARFHARRRRRALGSIRESLAFFGHDVSDMSDEEIEAGVRRSAEAARRTGVTVEQAVEGLRVLRDLPWPIAPAPGGPRG